MHACSRRYLLGRAARALVAGITAGASLTGCKSTHSVSSDFSSETRELRLHAGDVVKLVTVNRERFRIRILDIGTEGMRGEVLKSRQSTLPPGGTVEVRYADLALLQEEHVSVGRTAGAVLIVGLVGAMVAFAAVGAPVVAAPPP